MKTTFLALAVAVALTGCDKQDKDKAASKDTEPVPEVVEGSAKPADPTASWTERKAPGFVVRSPRAPNERHTSATTPLGPQPVITYSGYEPAGFEGAFMTLVSDMSGVKAQDTRDPKQKVDDAVRGLLDAMPGTKLDKDEPIAGVDGARSIVASGNHPQGGPFHLLANIYFHADKVLMAQAIYVDAEDEPLATAFVSSFQLVD
jgi:hypothetical protein